MVCFSPLNGDLKFTIKYTPNCVYNATSLPSCNHMKLKKVHPTFSKKLRRISNKSKTHSQSSERKDDFFAFFKFLKIFSKYPTTATSKTENDTSEFYDFFFAKNFPPQFFLLDPSGWFYQTTKKLSVDNIFFCDNSFFEFPILEEKSIEKNTFIWLVKRQIWKNTAL